MFFRNKALILIRLLLIVCISNIGLIFKYLIVILLSLVNVMFCVCYVTLVNYEMKTLYLYRLDSIKIGDK